MRNCFIKKLTISQPKVELAVNRCSGGSGGDGRGIADANIVGNDLIIVYTDGTSENVGRVVGENGINGVNGRGIVSITQPQPTTARVTYTDSTVEDLTLPVAPSTPEFLITAPALFEDFDKPTQPYLAPYGLNGATVTLSGADVNSQFRTFGVLTFNAANSNGAAGYRITASVLFIPADVTLELVTSFRFSTANPAQASLHPTLFYFGISNGVSIETLTNQHQLVAGIQFVSARNRYEFFFNARSNGVNSIENIQDFLPSENTQYKFQITRSATQVQLFINGVLRSTITTNLPTVATGLGVAMVRNGGTGSFNTQMVIDYLYARYTNLIR